MRYNKNMLKHILTLIRATSHSWSKAIFLPLMLITFNIITFQNTYAATCGGASTGILGCDNGGDGGIFYIIHLVVNILTIGVGILSVIGISIFGIQYLTSRDNQTQNEKAKRRLYEIIIGLGCFVLLWAIVQWLFPSGITDRSLVDIKSIEVSYSGTPYVNETFTPTVKTDNPSIDPTYSLTSSDSSVMRVRGLSLQCIKEGSATIEASAPNGVKGSATFSCQEKPEPEDSNDDDPDSTNDPDDNPTPTTNPNNGSTNDNPSSGNNNNSNKKKEKVIIILGASQIVRIADTKYANVKSYTSASKIYTIKNKTLNFIRLSGSGAAYQAGSGWRGAQAIINRYSKKKDTAQFFVYFTLVGNDIAGMTCDSISFANQTMANQIATYNNLIAEKKNEGYDVNGYVTSVQPVEPNNANASKNKVVRNNNAKKCKAGYRSNFKYRQYNNVMSAFVNNQSNLTYVNTFDYILNASYGFTSNWRSYRTTDGLHWNNATAKKYFKFWMGLNNQL